MNPKIRCAKSDDAETIARFNILLASETENITLDPATILAGVRAGLSDESKAMYFLAEIDGKIVGQLMVTHEWSDWRNGDIWWIQSVYVDAKFRLQRVFKSLYRHVCDRAKTVGAAGIRLYVDADNLAAQKTYESLGMHASNYRLMEAMIHPSQAE